MTVLLDTQILIGIGVDGIESLPTRTRKLMLDPETKRVVSAVSLTEIAIQTSIGKITSSPGHISSMLADLKLDVIPFTSRHAMQMFELPLHHREPFDRMLIATAITENMPLVGGDARFSLYIPQGLSVIWK